ncbi:uncharacterized protein PAC_16842 [Phialocephala subalpina]|uniref:Uncharacterized protein n=1 Tax=Phialocephala subalpina TaxID=576137 RepID=A0A1L7XPJ7_9HELO|nr:uncharacterized protein PAC_16842 [Phialocephala subalpina]
MSIRINQEGGYVYVELSPGPQYGELYEVMYQDNRHIGRSIPEPVYNQNEYYNLPLSPGGNTFTQSTHHINARAQRWGEWGQVIKGGQINGEDYFGDDTVLKPWLYGNWYTSDENEKLLIGMGIRLGESAEVIAAEGNTKDNVTLRGSQLRLRTADKSTLAHLIPGRFPALFGHLDLQAAGSEAG